MRGLCAVPIGRWVFALAAAASLAVPSAASAQDAAAAASLRGVVLSGDASPVTGAAVTLATAGRPPRTVVTADDGGFFFPGADAGPASLYVRRIGFRAESLSVTLPVAGAAPFTVRLRVVPQALAPVVVHGVRELRPGPLKDFYARRDNGFGRYITRGDIERTHPMYTTDLLRMVAGVSLVRTGFMDQIRMRGSACGPEVFIDGTPLGPLPFDFNSVTPGSIEGIEIYMGVSTVPVEFARSFGRSACGTILVWTREGEPSPRKRKKSPPVTSAELARLVEGLQLFTAEQVDSAARPDEDFATLVRLPDAMNAWAAPAGVIAEFVVDTAGHVEAGTINVVASPGPEFSEAVRAALPGAGFSPAQRQGRPVRQLVQLSVRFDPPEQRRRR